MLILGSMALMIVALSYLVFNLQWFSFDESIHGVKDGVEIEMSVFDVKIEVQGKTLDLDKYVKDNCDYDNKTKL